MGPKNAVMGDVQDTMALPQTKVPQQFLVEEQKMAKFSKTKEYQKLKNYIENRVEYYKHFLPNGKEVGVHAQPTSEDWRVANRVIAEFQAILQEYENAKEIVGTNES